MESRISFLIYSEGYDGYLNKLADGITDSKFKALWFSTREEAEKWMMGIHAPKDIENFEIRKTLTTIQEVEDDANTESGTEES